MPSIRPGGRTQGRRGPGDRDRPLLKSGVLRVAGDLSGVPLMSGVRELLHERALPFGSADLQEVTARLGDNAGVIEAAARSSTSSPPPTTPTPV